MTRYTAETVNIGGHLAIPVDEPGVYYITREKHEHEWQPAGVTESTSSPFPSTYVWAMCKCGEITVRQWDQ